MPQSLFEAAALENRLSPKEAEELREAAAQYCTSSRSQETLASLDAEGTLCSLDVPECMFLFQVTSAHPSDKWKHVSGGRGTVGEFDMFDFAIVEYSGRVSVNESASQVAVVDFDPVGLQG